MTPLELFEKNEKLAYHVLHKYYPTYSQYEDYKQLALLGLWVACITYDENKGIKFSSYAGKCIMNEIRLSLRYTNNHYIETVSIDKKMPDTNQLTISDVLEDENALIDLDYKLLLTDIENTLTTKELELLRDLARTGNIKDLSEGTGLSYQAIWSKRNKIYKKLKEAGVFE